MSHSMERPASGTYPLRTDPLPFSRRSMVVFLFAMAWLSAIAWWHRYVVMDDPWITFRYAQNLLAGNGWAFNPGEPLEGYSNFLWVLLSLVPLGLGVEPLGFARFAGWLSAVGAVGLLAFGLGRREAVLYIPRSRRAAILLAGCYPLAVWSVGGLETAFHTLLVMLYGFALAGLMDRPEARRGAVAGVLLLALGLSRPEGAMFAALLVLVPLWRRTAEGWRGTAVAVAVFGAGYLVYTLWRLQTFGTIVPNTVSAKVGGGPVGRALEGLGYAYDYFRGPPSVLLLLGLLAGWRWRKAVVEGSRVPPGRAPGLVPAMGAIVLLQGAFAVAVGGDWMPGSRFLVPLLPALCVVAAVGLRRWLPPLQALVIFFLLAGGLLQARQDPELRWCRWAAKEAGGELLVQPLAEAGDWLRRHSFGEGLLAGSEAGMLPYRSGLEFVDMLGLVDAHLAALPGGLHEKFDAEYVLSREPDFIALTWVDEVDGPWPAWEADGEMAGNERFQTEYGELVRFPRLLPSAHWDMRSAHLVLYGRGERVRAE